MGNLLLKMKTRIDKYIFCLVLYSVSVFSAEKAEAQDLFWLVQDSAYSYVYDDQSAVWNFSGAVYYYGEPGFLDSTITTGNDGNPVSKSVYQYQSGAITGVMTMQFTGSDWINSQQQVFLYDNDKLVERIVTRWVAENWQNLNRFTYSYDQDNFLKVYDREIWSNGMWTEYSADSLFYDESGKIILRSARLKSIDKYITRTIYSYNSSGRKSAQVRQDWINGQWVNINRSLYYYNSCGTQTISETEKWSDGSWQPNSRSEIFYHYEISPDVTRVPVCNRGNTRYVSVNALDGFLSRGACLGECLEEKADTKIASARDEIESRPMPFIVYPNPARNMVTVKMASEECPATEIVLLDFSGRVLQNINPGSRTEIPIDLTILKHGNYILKVTSDTVYSTLISKQ